VVVRHIDVDLALIPSISIENLNATVAAVGHIHIARIIRSDTVRRIELAWTSSRFAPGLDPVSVFIDLGYPGIDVTVTDISIACCVPGYIGDLAKLPVDRLHRRLGVLDRTSALVGGFLLAAQDHQYPAFRTELNDHVRSLVSDPNVVFLVNLDGMGIAPCIQMVADLTDVLSIGVKLEQLGRRRSVCWAGRAATREVENVPL